MGQQRQAYILTSQRDIMKFHSAQHSARKYSPSALSQVFHRSMDRLICDTLHQQKSVPISAERVRSEPCFPKPFFPGRLRVLSDLLSLTLQSKDSFCSLCLLCCSREGIKK